MTDYLIQRSFLGVSIFFIVLLISIMVAFCEYNSCKNSPSVLERAEPFKYAKKEFWFFTTHITIPFSILYVVAMILDLIGISLGVY